MYTVNIDDTVICDGFDSIEEAQEYISNLPEKFKIYTAIKTIKVSKYELSINGPFI